MDKVLPYAIVGVVVLLFLVYFVIQIVKFCKMTNEERKSCLLGYLAGLVTLAEDKIGSGHGEEKLAEVESYFKEHAGFIYRLILRAFGKENLKGLIEEALDLVKKNFMK